MSENKVGRPTKYPWEEMNVDDHFDIDYNYNQAVIYVCRVNKRYAPKKFKAIEYGSDVVIKRIA